MKGKNMKALAHGGVGPWALAARGVRVCGGADVPGWSGPTSAGEECGQYELTVPNPNALSFIADHRHRGILYQIWCRGSGPF